MWLTPTSFSEYPVQIGKDLSGIDSGVNVHVMHGVRGRMFRERFQNSDHVRPSEWERNGIPISESGIAFSPDFGIGLRYRAARFNPIWKSQRCKMRCCMFLCVGSWRVSCQQESGRSGDGGSCASWCFRHDCLFSGTADRCFPTRNAITYVAIMVVASSRRISIPRITARTTKVNSMDVALVE